MERQRLREQMSNEERTYRRVAKEGVIGQVDEPSSRAGQEAFYKVQLGGHHRFYLLLFSVLAGGINVAWPFLSNFASLSQAQALYTGQMLTKGLLPYTDIFATGGILYYALIGLAYLLGSSLWLLVPQVVAFYVSGVYFYRLVGHLTKSTELALVVSLVFYLLNASIGFGGLYPIQFAQPFVLIGLWFLTKCFAKQTPDESFIVYGFLGAISSLIEPRTVIFWVLSAVTAFIVSKPKAHGFYQLLCQMFGAIIVLYSVGYFLVNLQILGPSVAQGLVYHLTALSRDTQLVWLAVAVQLALALGAGLLSGLFGFVSQVQEPSSAKVVKWLVLLMLLITLTYASLSQSFDPAFLLPVLPYGLILTALWFKERQDKLKQVTSHRRQKEGQFNSQLFSAFLGRQFYLPVLAMVLGFAYPIWQGLTQASLSAERARVAVYLQENTVADQSIYVWDDSTKIYQESQLPPSSNLILPVGYTSQKANRQLLEDDLLQNQASYVIVNQNLPLSATLSKNLQENYKALTIKQVKQFTVYRME